MKRALMIFLLYEKKFINSALRIRKGSKNADGLERRYRINKEIVDRKLRRLYKIRLKHPKLLLLLRLSQS